MVHYLTILFDSPHSFLRSTKHLGKIRRLGYIQFLHFLLYVNSLKKCFEQKQNLPVLKNL